MISSFDTKFGASNLTIKYAPNSRTKLDNKLVEMNALYAKKEQRFVPDDNASKGIDVCGVELSLKQNENGIIKFNFIDIPGEWLENNPPADLDGEDTEFSAADSAKIDFSKIDFSKDLLKLKITKENLSDIVKVSSVIIVAIDTPHLMEEAPNDTGNSVGIYNDRRNRTGIVCDFLKELKFSEKDRMVIFVPLKNERYWHSGEMELVNARIHTAYKSFFNHISNVNIRDRCTAVIAPIFTFGTIEFAYFDRDKTEKHEIIIDEKYKTPKYPYYEFTDKAGNEPEPKYCEQPLLYVLLYIFKCAERSRLKQYKNWFTRFFAAISETFLNMPSAEDFLKEAQNIQENITTEGDGYEIAHDAIGLGREDLKC